MNANTGPGIEGTWDVVSTDTGGGPDPTLGLQLDVSKERLILRAPNGATKLMGYVARVDPTKSPSEIDLRNGDLVGRGIYALEGDTLSVVIADPGKPRPWGFRGTPKSMLFRLRRAAEQASTLPRGECAHLKEIEAHIEQHIGKVERVFHEMQSAFVHIDVLLVPASADRPYHVLVTSGVSDEPMTMPEGLEKWRRIELGIALPQEWPLTDEALADERNSWPIHWLRRFGRFPHAFKTWIGWRHTIPNGNPPEQAPATGFTSVLIEPFCVPPEFQHLTLESGELLTFFMILPLYPEELDFKVAKGAIELEERLQRADAGFILDPKRPNVALKRS